MGREGPGFHQRSVDLAMQNRAMREYAARRGWTIALQVREVNSGAARREAREKLLAAARRRQIDVVLVWRAWTDDGAGR
jgi:putative DNA-invertase from lambdoid prophage Rac